MVNNRRRAEKRAANEAAYWRQYEARQVREAEYAERWRELYASLEKAGVDPNELKLWIEELTK